MPLDQRRETILDAAEAVFLEAGFAASNMDDIARRAGMSKRTVYEFFGTKELLFNALIDLDRTGNVPDLDASDASDELVVDYLTALAVHISSPRQIAIQRVVFAEFWRDRQRALGLFRDAERKGPGLLSRWIARQVETKRVAPIDPEEAADMLFGMAIGSIHFKSLLLGYEQILSHADLRARIARAVAIFMTGSQA